MKHHEQHARLAFDEQRALEDLQKLHREIQRARSDRERAEGEFDEFVRGFRDGAPAPSPRPPHREREPRTEFTLEIGTRGEAERPDFDPAHIDAASGWRAASAHAEVPVESAVPAPVPPPRRRAHPIVIVSVIALAAAAAALALWARAGGPAEPGSPPAQAVERATAGGASAAPREGPSAANTSAAAAGSTAAAAGPGVNLELVTRRPVWVRVTIDDRRAMERELPAGQRIPLHGERTIVIRAGNAGAVAVSRDGRDQGPLGAEGAVITRRFDAGPAPRPR